MQNDESFHHFHLIWFDMIVKKLQYAGECAKMHVWNELKMRSSVEHLKCFGQLSEHSNLTICVHFSRPFIGILSQCVRIPLDFIMKCKHKTRRHVQFSEINIFFSNFKINKSKFILFVFRLVASSNWFNKSWQRMRIDNIPYSHCGTV